MLLCGQSDKYLGMKDGWLRMDNGFSGKLNGYLDIVDVKIFKSNYKR